MKKHLKRNVIIAIVLLCTLFLAFISLGNVNKKPTSLNEVISEQEVGHIYNNLKSYEKGMHTSDGDVIKDNAYTMVIFEKSECSYCNKLNNYIVDTVNKNGKKLTNKQIQHVDLVNLTKKESKKLATEKDFNYIGTPKVIVYDASGKIVRNVDGYSDCKKLINDLLF